MSISYYDALSPVREPVRPGGAISHRTLRRRPVMHDESAVSSHQQLHIG